MMAIRPSKKSRTPMITISQPANAIQPLQVLLLAIPASRCVVCRAYSPPVRIRRAVVPARRRRRVRARERLVGNVKPQPEHVGPVVVADRVEALPLLEHPYRIELRVEDS